MKTQGETLNHLAYLEEPRFVIQSSLNGLSAQDFHGEPSNSLSELFQSGPKLFTAGEKQK